MLFSTGYILDPHDICLLVLQVAKRRVRTNALFQDINMQKVRKAIFPVGGLGTRFLPATKALTKEMLQIVDKPLIQYAVEEAANAGIEDFIFVTGRNKSAI